MSADQTFLKLKDELRTLALEIEAGPQGAVLFLTLNRPGAFNAVSMELLHEMHLVLDALQHPLTLHEPLPQKHPRVLVIRAAGKAFSGGVDIKVGRLGWRGILWEAICCVPTASVANPNPY